MVKRSSEGISPYFVLLGTMSVNFLLAYILALPVSREDMACCKVNDGLSCFAGLLGAVQIAVQFGCFWLMSVLLPLTSSLVDSHALFPPLSVVSL